MPGRTFAIGDIHGCSDTLAALIDAIGPKSDDTIVTLGDYIDRGPQSCGVLVRLIALAENCRLKPLLGDHEYMLLNALVNKDAMRNWLTLGGGATLRSYGWTPGGPRRALAGWIPRRHLEFLKTCRLYHETATHVFVHAGFVPELPMNKQPHEALLWRVTDAKTAKPHSSGKVAVVGHTRQLSGEVLNLGFLVCIDTNCVRGGWLTALEVQTGRVWQAQGKAVRQSRIDL